MKSKSSGNVHRLRDIPSAVWKEHLQHRAVELAPISERSSIPSWTEFCMRFGHRFSQVRATVGSTSNPERFKEFIDAANNITPLPGDIVEEITTLQVRWSDEVDMNAEAWSM